jgi:hypothetical protein
MSTLENVLEAAWNDSVPAHPDGKRGQWPGSLQFHWLRRHNGKQMPTPASLADGVEENAYVMQAM